MTLSFLGETINIMTLGGLALAVGILVDAPRLRSKTSSGISKKACPARCHPGRRGANRVPAWYPRSASASCSADVPAQWCGPLPLCSLSPKLLCSRILASYILVPDARAYAGGCNLLKAKQATLPVHGILSCGSSERFERGRTASECLPGLLEVLVHSAGPLRPIFSLACVAVVSPCACSVRIFSEHRQRSIHSPSPRKSGTRIERPRRLCDFVEGTIRRESRARGGPHPGQYRAALPLSIFFTAHQGLIGAGDADILVSLKEDHHATADYVQRLRERCPGNTPARLLLLPSDIVTQVLNFGLCRRPLNIQIRDRYRGQSRSRSPHAA